MWECFWTVILAKGQITVEGPFDDNGTDTMLAITGGTGAYKEARGQMRLHVHTVVNGVTTKYDFFYQVEMQVFPTGNSASLHVQEGRVFYAIAR